MTRISRGHKAERQPRAVQRARELRRNETEVERRLWYAIRDRGIAGAKFRRQVSVGPYVADFACITHKLVIELDGGQHAENTQADAARTRILGARGFRVLRFWNNDVIENLDGIIETIRTVIEVKK